jgi:hypothetical protein
MAAERRDEMALPPGRDYVTDDTAKIGEKTSKSIGKKT